MIAAILAGGLWLAQYDPLAQAPAPAPSSPPAAKAPGSIGDPEHEAALRRIAQAYVTDVLIDPDSAEFRWPDLGEALATGVKTWRFERALPGSAEIVCGRVNAKNRMGGYAGYAWFWVAIQDGEVRKYVLDEGGAPPWASAAQQCAHLGF